MDEGSGKPAATGYAGDVDPSEAYAALQADPLAVLVDVRTTRAPDIGDLVGAVAAV